MSEPADTYNPRTHTVEEPPQAPPVSPTRKGSYSPKHTFLGDTYSMAKGSEVPEHHGTVEHLHLHEPMGQEPPIAELPIHHHEQPQQQQQQAPLGKDLIPEGVESPANQLPCGGAEQKLRPIAVGHADLAPAGGEPEHGGRVEPATSPRQARFLQDTYKMARGSEAPEHHGTVEKLHLHEPRGNEPPIAELPIKHGEHAGAPPGPDHPLKLMSHKERRHETAGESLLGEGGRKLDVDDVGLTATAGAMLTDPLGPEPEEVVISSSIGLVKGGGGAEADEEDFSY